MDGYCHEPCCDSWHSSGRQENDCALRYQFWLVHALARYPGHVKNRQQLMHAAQAVLDDNTITSHIKRIRRKFHAIDPDFDAIETVYGMGYRWLTG